MSLLLHEYHASRKATFTLVGGVEAVQHFGDPKSEYAALHEGTGIIDLSFRSRLCLTGGDRHRFLNGQVTNNVKDLKPGDGCYAALITAKGRMQSDLNVYCLENELLLDFEPGLTEAVTQRLDKYVIADDVQIVDVGSAYGQITLQGPKAATVLVTAGISSAPERELAVIKVNHTQWGEAYVARQQRTVPGGFDVFLPAAALQLAFESFLNAGATRCGWEALEWSRIEAGIPRFGADMDETNLPPEAGIDQRAVSYTKGCYIGQEIIARLRTYGQVAKALRGLRFQSGTRDVPVKGTKLFSGQKEVGYITSAVASPRFQETLALAYVRRECNAPGTELVVGAQENSERAMVVTLPFEDR